VDNPVENWAANEKFVPGSGKKSWRNLMLLNRIKK
jgi:hypothetical protein